MKTALFGGKELPKRAAYTADGLTATSALDMALR